MTHPSHDQLRRFLDEGLAPLESETLAAHVNGCDDCLAALERLQRAAPLDLRLLAGVLAMPPAGSRAHADTTPGRQGASANGHRAEAAPRFLPQATGTMPPHFSGYELLARICSGGMGEIYQARQRSTGRIVALKTLHSGYGLQSPHHHEALIRFRTEIEGVSRLRHENIIAIYDVGEEEGRPFYSMEWASGGTFAERLAGKPQAQRNAAQWLTTLAHAVQHIHGHGLVHRDLKPANILQQQNDDAPAGSEPKLKIGDFGVAKLLDREDGATRPHQWVGTPEYMAPEQAATKAEKGVIGPAADIYSLGVVFYEMLTGRPPFQSPEPLETLRRVREEEPVPPRRLHPKISRDLETICLKCLQKEPARRYRSAVQLAEDLERWLNGQPILARPAGWPTRAVKWSRRHPERAALLGVGAIMGAALLVGSIWQSWTASARYTQQLANSTSHQLLLIKYAVSQSAQDPHLKRLLEAPAEPGPLRRHLERTRQEFARWFTRPGETPPIINWFVMDARGTILADSYEEPRSVGRNYRFRDYFLGAVHGSAAGQADPYVSRVYESEQDQRYKFTVIAAIPGAPAPGAFLAASIPTDSRLVALDMKNEVAGAMVVAPLDHEKRSQAATTADRPADFVVVLQRSYATPGQAPASVPVSVSRRLATFADNPALAEAADVCSDFGAWVHYARVGDSRLVVVVEHPYPWPAAWLGRFPRWSAAAGSAVLASLMWLALRLRRHSRIQSEVAAI